MVTILVVTVLGAFVAGILLGVRLQLERSKSEKERTAIEAFISAAYWGLAYAAAKSWVKTANRHTVEFTSWRLITQLFRYWVKKYPRLLWTINGVHSGVTEKINVQFSLDEDLEGQLTILMEVIPWRVVQVQENGDFGGESHGFWTEQAAREFGGAMVRGHQWSAYALFDPWENSIGTFQN